jgi:hypothetical protein
MPTTPDASNFKGIVPTYDLKTGEVMEKPKL